MDITKPHRVAIIRILPQGYGFGVTRDGSSVFVGQAIADTYPGGLKLRREGGPIYNMLLEENKTQNGAEYKAMASVDDLFPDEDEITDRGDPPPQPKPAPAPKPVLSLEERDALVLGLLDTNKAVGWAWIRKQVGGRAPDGQIKSTIDRLHRVGLVWRVNIVKSEGKTSGMTLYMLGTGKALPISAATIVYRDGPVASAMFKAHGDLAHWVKERLRYGGEGDDDRLPL